MGKNGRTTEQLQEWGRKLTLFRLGAKNST
jgi:hypothetical protein